MILECPFCKWKPGSWEALFSVHVREKHLSSWNTCFCGEHIENFSEHLAKHGGLEAHAQDHLMGVVK